MKINNTMIRKVGAVLLAVLLLVYVCYHAFFINDKGLATETAMYAELSDTIQASGWAVRNEALITNSESGVLNFNVADGEKVAPGNSIADIYDSEESATSRSRISRLNTEIANLEVLKNAGDFYSSSADLIGAQINESLSTVLSITQKGDYQAVYTEREHLQHLLNQKRVIVGKESSESFQQRIDELKGERDDLVAAASERSGYIESKDSGYFISNADGYERAFDIENIANTTVSDIQNVKKGTIPQNAVGKVSKDFSWYIVCVVDEQQKIKLEGITNVKMEIPLVTVEKIPAQIVSVNPDEKSGTYAVVIKCNYMNPEIAAIRNETVQIITASYAGVLVSQKAIHFNTVTTEVKDEKGTVQKKTQENVKGVYIKYGQKISFVQVFSDITINGYAVCKLNLSEEEAALLVTEDTIQLYDEVVIEGTNLYDGKLL